MKKNIILLVLSLVSIVAVAVIGSLFVGLGMEWYEKAVTPAQWPPAIIFPIVWTSIYSLFAFYVIYEGLKDMITAEIYILLLINGVLNIAWCFAFFSQIMLFIGLAIIIINCAAAYLLIVKIGTENKFFGYLLSLYPLWISVATCLNLAIWILN